ncbi:MAG: LacI family DNA-binding transcriptional regulator [Verrucomicrobiota bacterium]|nr:LacI family DNA-binding transcriptional regulator [Verrucomicrobiota bacterium]
MKKVTIIEIAKECGVSKTTVGDALNPNKSFRVSEKTRDKIVAAAKRLEYVPNQPAKMLRSKKTNVIGVMLPDPSNSFYGEIILKLQKKLTGCGYTAFFVFWNDLDDVEAMNKALRSLSALRVDGIVTAELPGVHLKKSNIPVVFWQNAPDIFDSVSNLDSIKTGYQELIKKLMEKSCRKFAILSPNPREGRSAQVFESLKDAGLEPVAEYLEVASTQATAQEAMKRLLKLKTPPDVILANNDMLAMSAMAEAIRSGIKVPDEMKFVGFDGTKEAEFTYPALTTFKVDVDDVVDKLLELLFRRIKDNNATPLKVPTEPELIIRNST